MSPDSSGLDRWRRWDPWLLVLVTVLVYAASLSGDFLAYDDDWLIEQNELLHLPFGDAVRCFFFDLDPQTRLSLGAEYLPLRDLSVWLDSHLFGVAAPPMRVVQLTMWLGASLAFRAAFIRTVGPARGMVLAWLFALHPTHVESVAWLAGRKDVLALLFMGLALVVHTREDSQRWWKVAALWLAACLSKSMSVGFLGPLLATDLLLGRPLDRRTYGISGVMLIGVLAMHAHVGTMVHMVGGPLAGDRGLAARVMGIVVLRYFRTTLDPSGASLRYDIDLEAEWTVSAVTGWLLLAGWLVVGLVVWRRRAQPLVFAAWLWFAVPLGPVSQVLVPLQNVMADRYLWLSVAGPLLLLVHVDRLAPARVLRWAPIPFVLLFAMGTALRAPEFANTEALWRGAVARTEDDPVATYGLGKALEERGALDEALSWYRETIRRGGLAHRQAPKATNNIAKILFARGDVEGARAVLVECLNHWPGHPKMTSNLARVDAALANRPPHQ